MMPGPELALVCALILGAPSPVLLATLCHTPTGATSRILASRGVSHGPAMQGPAIFSRRPTTCFTVPGVAGGRCVANAQPPGPGAVIDSVLAIVDTHLILLSDVRAFLDLRLIEPPDAVDPTASVLSALIERRLMLEAEIRYSPEAPPADDVDTRLAEVVGRVGGIEVFSERLLVVGFTVDDVRQELQHDLMIERYLTRRWGAAGQLTESDVAARQALIDDWVVSLYARAEVQVTR